MEMTSVHIIRVVRGSDLHETSSESHANDNIDHHYWNTTIYEGMDGKPAVKVLWC